MLLSPINNLDYGQLIKLGVHIGHSIKNTLAQAAWLIYGFRREIVIINLYKFVAMFRLGFPFVDGAVFRNRAIWFATQDRALNKYVRILANRCGEFSTALYWIRGMLSNFKVVSRSRKRTLMILGAARSPKQKLFYTNFKNWFYTRGTWPNLVVLTSLGNSYFIAREALSARIACLGIADTNVYAQSCSIAVPGNDDSIDCVVFYNQIIASYILYRKFAAVFVWYLNVRRGLRLTKFNKWLKAKLKAKSGIAITNFFYFFNPYGPQTRDWNAMALKFFFAKDAFYSRIIETLVIGVKGLNFSRKIPLLVNRFNRMQDKYLFLLDGLFFKRAFAIRSFIPLGKRRRRRRKWKASITERRVIRKIAKESVYKFKHLYHLTNIFPIKLRGLGHMAGLLHLLFIMFFFKKNIKGLMGFRYLVTALRKVKEFFFILVFYGVFKRKYSFFRKSFFLNFSKHREEVNFLNRNSFSRFLKKPKGSKPFQKFSCLPRIFLRSFATSVDIQSEKGKKSKKKKRRSAAWKEWDALRTAAAWNGKGEKEELKEDGKGAGTPLVVDLKELARELAKELPLKGKVPFDKLAFIESQNHWRLLLFFRFLKLFIYQSWILTKENSFTVWDFFCYYYYLIFKRRWGFFRIFKVLAGWTTGILPLFYLVYFSLLFFVLFLRTFYSLSEVVFKGFLFPKLKREFWLQWGQDMARVGSGRSFGVWKLWVRWEGFFSWLFPRLDRIHDKVRGWYLNYFGLAGLIIFVGTLIVMFIDSLTAAIPRVRFFILWARAELKGTGLVLYLLFRQELRRLRFYVASVRFFFRQLREARIKLGYFKLLQLSWIFFRYDVIRAVCHDFVLILKIKKLRFKEPFYVLMWRYCNELCFYSLGFYGLLITLSLTFVNPGVACFAIA